MPRKVILISCVSRKGNKINKAKDLYRSALFKSYLAYAYRQKPDKIFILSALHDLLELDELIAPYNVTLSKVPKTKRKPGLAILAQSERMICGQQVVKPLPKKTDLKNGKSIFRQAKNINLIRNNIKMIVTALERKKYDQRVKFLNEN